MYESVLLIQLPIVCHLFFDILLWSSHPAVFQDFDYCFAENGLTAYKAGKELESQSFIGWIGEEKYKQMVKFILHYIADLDIPVKR